MACPSLSRQRDSANRRSIAAIGIKPLTSLFRPSDRKERRAGEATEEGTKMKKFGITAVIASGLTAAVIGLAGPAQADSEHHQWLDRVSPTVNVPQVDTTVHQSR
jgi:hypothetical protein